MRLGKGSGWAVDDRGQSFVELALAFPVLLLILLGLADFGRAFFYTSAIANAAREGAAYASLNAGTATPGTVSQKVLNETGFMPYGAPCPPPDPCPLSVSVEQNGSPVTTTVAKGSDVKVTVTYGFRLISAYLVDRIVGTQTIQLRASATYPGLN
jgi:Flp pilus assembly protein TadG